MKRNAMLRSFIAMLALAALTASGCSVFGLFSKDHDYTVKESWEIKAPAPGLVDAIAETAKSMRFRCRVRGDGQPRARPGARADSAAAPCGRRRFQVQGRSALPQRAYRLESRLCGQPQRLRPHLLRLAGRQIYRGLRDGRGQPGVRQAKGRDGPAVRFQEKAL